MPSPAQILEREHLIDDEGVMYKPYVDSRGKTTIGVGRNLDDVGLHPDEVDRLLDNDIQAATDAAEKYLGADPFHALSTDRQGVLINMAFNLGYARLCGFKKLKAAVLAGRYNDAANEMLDSSWARQVGARAERLSERMRG